MTVSTIPSSPAGTSLPLRSGEIAERGEARLSEPLGAHRGPAKYSYVVVVGTTDGTRSKSLLVTEHEKEAVDLLGAVNEVAPHLIVSVYRYRGSESLCILRVEPGPINPYPPSSPFDPRR